MGLDSILSNGGRILVVGGHWNKGWDTWKDHPAVIWWNGEQKDIVRQLKNHENRLPERVRGVILSRFISHAESSIILKESRKRQILIMGVLNDGEITEKLSQILKKPDSTTPMDTPLSPPEVTEKPTMNVSKDQTKGWLKRFIETHHQSDLITSQEGARLFKLADENKLSTTIGSMRQAVSVYRKSLGIVVGNHHSLKRKSKSASTIPMPPHIASKRVEEVEPPSEIEIITKMVDDAIAGLRLIRENIAKLHKQNSEYLKLKNRLAKLVKES